MVQVWARINRANSALMSLLRPDRAEIVDVNGYAGVLFDTGVVFDVSPTYQIAVTRETPDSQVTDDQLLALARTVVAISADEFAAIDADAATHRLTPTDMPCGFYLRVEAVGGGAVLAILPNSVPVDLSTTQPMATVTLSVRSATDTRDIPVLTVTHLTDPQHLEVSWDGMIDGAPAPAGDYTLSADGTPLNDPDDTLCRSDAGYLGNSDITFRVP